MATLKPEEIRALAFIDVDQTLVEGEDGQFWQGESWLLLTAAFTASIDTHIEIFSRFREAVNGNDDDDEHLHNIMALELINLWEEAWGGPITQEVLEAVCEFIQTRVSQEAQDSVVELIGSGILPILATGGFENSAQAIAELLKLHETIIEDTDTSDLKMWFGNTEFVFDEEGFLTTFHHKKDIIGHKRTQAIAKVQEIVDLLGLDDDIPVMAIGDGKSDLGLFMKYYGIAYKPTNHDLKMAAKSVAENWSQVVAQALAFVEEAESDSNDNTPTL